LLIRTRKAKELRQGYDRVNARVGSSAVWQHPGADEQFAGELKCVGGGLGLSPVFARTFLVPEGLQYRLQGGRALGGQVSGYPAGIVDRGALPPCRRYW